MSHSLRLMPAVLGLLALGTVGLLVGPGARADEGTPAPKLPATWVYDVRVVRIDAADSAVLEVAPPWEPAGAAGTTTTSTWADLLVGLKARGRATILLDQRSTAWSGVRTALQQVRRRPLLTLRNRNGATDLWEASYVETGTKAELVSSSHGLSYDVNVRWEESPGADLTPLGSTEWSGSCSDIKSGETLVLSHRQQQVAQAPAPQGLEIYVFITGWSVPAK